MITMTWDLTIAQLRTILADRSVPTVTRMRRPDLVALVEASDRDSVLADAWTENERRTLAQMRPTHITVTVSPLMRALLARISNQRGGRSAHVPNVRPARKVTGPARKRVGRLERRLNRR